MSKTKFAKYHALRIIKALKANEDPNLTNPVQEQPELLSPPQLDPSDPEVQRINQGAPLQSPQNPYQPYVESAPDTAVQPSPTYSATQPSALPPNLPPAPTGYTQSPHHVVSPLSQPATSRQGSIVSVGGGYFPSTDPVPPTFTAEPAAPGLPTALSANNNSLTASLPSSPQIPQVSSASDAASFYQNVALPPSTAPQQQPPQNTMQSLQQPPPRQQYVSPSHHNPYTQQAVLPPQQFSQGSFRNDEDSIIEATKHAKWAISALNFEDAATAVKELRIALGALGAN